MIKERVHDPIVMLAAAVLTQTVEDIKAGGDLKTDTLRWMDENENFIAWCRAAKVDPYKLRNIVESY